MKSGRFREDLFYRLDVITLRLPPLRERPEEIASLCAHLCSRIARDEGIPEPTLTPEAVEALRAQPLRGNVRDLENILRRSALLSGKVMLGPSDLQFAKHSLSPPPVSPEVAESSRPSAPASVDPENDAADEGVRARDDAPRARAVARLGDRRGAPPRHRPHDVLSAREALLDPVVTRALLVAPSGRFRGGVERHVHDLAVGLRERGHEIALAVARRRAVRRSAFVAPFTRVELLASLSSGARAVDVVYAHKPIVADALVAAAAVAPVFVAVHDHDLTCVRSHRYLPVSLEPCHRPPGVACVTHGCCVVRSQGPLKVALKSPFALRADLHRLADAARFVAASQYLADRLTDAGVAASRVDVIHPATRDEPSTITPPPADRALLFVGQLVRGKGLDLLLRALPSLVADLVVAGDGSGRAEAEALARELGVGARVRFLGAVAPRLAMPALYDAGARRRRRCRRAGPSRSGWSASRRCGAVGSSSPRVTAASPSGSSKVAPATASSPVTSPISRRRCGAPSTRPTTPQRAPPPGPRSPRRASRSRTWSPRSSDSSSASPDPCPAVFHRGAPLRNTGWMENGIVRSATATAASIQKT